MSLYDQLAAQVTRPSRLTWSTYGTDYIIHRDQSAVPGEQGQWYVHFPEGKQLGGVWSVIAYDCDLEYDHARRAVQVEKVARQIDDDVERPHLGLHAWVRARQAYEPEYLLARGVDVRALGESGLDEVRYTPTGFVVPDRPGTVTEADVILFRRDGRMYGLDVR